MDINCRFPRQALHRFIYTLFLRFVFLLFLFICFAKAAFCRIAIGHEVASAMRRRCFFLKNLHKSPGRASSNWSPVNQKRQSVISYTPPPPAFPRRYTAGNLWRAAARCRLCPALWWTPPRRRINGCVLQRQTESEREWDVVLSLLAVCVLALNKFSLQNPKNVCDQNCSFLMFLKHKGMELLELTSGYQDGAVVLFLRVYQGVRSEHILWAVSEWGGCRCWR